MKIDLQYGTLSCIQNELRPWHVKVEVNKKQRRAIIADIIIYQGK